MTRRFLTAAIAAGAAAAVLGPAGPAAIAAEPFAAPASLQVCPGFSRRNLGTISARGRVDNYNVSIETPAGAILAAPTDPVCVSSGMGWRPTSGRRHDGVDYAPTSSRRGVYAAGPGVVAFVGWSGGYGRMVKIDHGHGVTTLYAHLSGTAQGLSTGDRVEVGEAIGTMGSTGNSTGVHLHYEIHVDGRSLDPLDAPAAAPLLIADAAPTIAPRHRPAAGDRVRATFATVEAARIAAAESVSDGGGAVVASTSWAPPTTIPAGADGAPRSRFVRLEAPAAAETLATQRATPERLRPTDAPIAFPTEAPPAERARPARPASEPIPFPTRDREAP